MPTLQKVLLGIAFVAASPLWLLVALALILWTLMGWACTAPYVRLSVGTWIILVVLFVVAGGFEGQEYDFNTSIRDAVAIEVFVTILYGVGLGSFEGSIKTAKARRLRVLPVPVVFAAFLIAKMVLIQGGATSASLRLVWLWVALFLSVAQYMSAGRWWRDASYEQLANAEAQLMDKYCEVPVKQKIVEGLGTLEVEGQWGEEADKPVLVLVHGWGAGNGFWMFNLGQLSMEFRVLSVELYGCGRSDRKPFKPRDREEGVRLLVDALERWVSTMGLRRFVLGGHSLGAMVAAHFAMRHPTSLIKLMLLSPAGVGRKESRAEDPAAEGEANNASKSLGVRVYEALWHNSITPMDLSRWLGPFGPKLIKWIVSRRFSRSPKTAIVKTVDQELLSNYIYQNWVRPASGERALFLMMDAWLFAYTPLQDILYFGEKGITCPLTIIYGSPSRDWMNAEHGQALAKEIVSQGGRAEVYSVPDAGHTLMVDNPGEFNQLFMEAFRDAFPRGVSGRGSIWADLDTEADLDARISKR
ncbi:unnamed protein product [Discosporangium mesarthrocarpum]